MNVRTTKILKFLIFQRMRKKKDFLLSQRWISFCEWTLSCSSTWDASAGSPRQEWSSVVQLACGLLALFSCPQCCSCRALRSRWLWGWVTAGLQGYLKISHFVCLLLFFRKGFFFVALAVNEASVKLRNPYASVPMQGFNNSLLGFLRFIKKIERGGGSAHL